MKTKCIAALLIISLMLSLFAGCSMKPATQQGDVPNPPTQDVPAPPAQDGPVPPVQDDPVPPVQDDPNQSEGGNEVVPPENPDTPDAAPVFHTVTVEHDSEKAAVSGLGDSYESGSRVSFTVQPKEGYVVDKVTCNDTEITAANGDYTFVISADTAIEVICKTRPITIVLTNDDSRGTVSGLKSEYAEGEVISFSVASNIGWVVYSVMVNGEEQDLPYILPAVNDGDYTMEIAVTYEDDSLEARRQKVVAYAKHLTGDYYYYEGGVPVAAADINNASHNYKALSANYIYRGVPYNEGLTSLAAYRTLPSEDIDGVYHITPDAFVERWYWLFGLSCADVPLWSWRTIDSSVNFVAAQYMTSDYGCIKVGEYEWTLKNGLLTDTYSDVNRNGSAVMDAAYAQLQPGDACTRIKGGSGVGHAILITAVDHENGTVTYCDTNGKAREANEMIDGMEVYRYGEYEKTVNYSWLRKNGYLPVTCAALRDESVTLPTFFVEDPVTAPTLENLGSGILSATQAISHVVVQIFNTDGEAVQEYIRYWSEDTFKMSDFKSTRLLTGWDAASSYTLPQYQLYAKENTISGDLGLEAGNYRCTVTAYNGGTSFDSDGNIRSNAYIIRDFDFTL